MERAWKRQTLWRWAKRRVLLLQLLLSDLRKAAGKQRSGGEGSTRARGRR